MAVEHNCRERVYDNGKLYSVTAYQEFLDTVSGYIIEHNKYPTVRGLAELCKVSIGTARKIIDIHKGKRVRTTVLNDQQKTIKYGNNSFELHEEMILLGQYFADTGRSLLDYFLKINTHQETFLVSNDTHATFRIRLYTPFFLKKICQRH
jgi:hypothetical protein